MDLPDVYCLVRPDGTHRTRMLRRFAEVDVPVTMVTAQATADLLRAVQASLCEHPTCQQDATLRQRALVMPTWPPNRQRAWAIMLGHIAVLQHAVQRTAEGYIVVCEDDVHLRRTLRADLTQTIVPHMKRHNLDLVLTGCLWPESPGPDSSSSSSAFRFLPYGDTTWGTQMYVLTLAHARHLLHTWSAIRGLTLEESDAQGHVLLTGCPFAADWTLTKTAAPDRRAVCVPLQAVEEVPALDAAAAVTAADRPNSCAHTAFHRQCHMLHFCPVQYTA